MSLLESLLKSTQGAPISELAAKFGISPDQTASALGHLVPELSKSLKQNASTKEGLDSLTRALEKGNHDRYVDTPSLATSDAGVQEGNGILGHIFGSKNKSREVAGQAAAKTGLDLGILKKMLPMVASMAMGSLKKSRGAPSLSNDGGSSGASSGKGGAGGLLGFLDRDGDGQIIDDVLGFAKGLFGKK